MTETPVSVISVTSPLPTADGWLLPVLICKAESKSLTSATLRERKFLASNLQHTHTGERRSLGGMLCLCAAATWALMKTEGQTGQKINTCESMCMREVSCRLFFLEQPGVIDLYWGPRTRPHSSIREWYLMTATAAVTSTLISAARPLKEKLPIETARWTAAEKLCAAASAAPWRREAGGGVGREEQQRQWLSTPGDEDASPVALCLHTRAGNPLNNGFVAAW